MVGDSEKSMILPILGITFHWALDWSDTQPVPAEKLPSRDPSLDQMVGGDYVAPKNGDLRLSGGGDGDSQGQLFHVEQLGSGEDVASEVDRVSALVGDLGELAGGFEAGADSGIDLDMRARYFAHEVNGLVGGISGRAQRAMISGDADQARVAIGMAADVGIRVASLCEFFMSRPSNLDGRTGGNGKSDNLVVCEKLDGLNLAQVLAVHEDAVVGVGGDGGVRYEVELGVGGLGLGVPLPGILLERVLVNLYSNAMSAMGGVDDCRAGGDRFIRLSGREVRASRGACPVGGGCGICLGRCVDPGYVSLVVEDSGPGMDGGGETVDGSIGGHGLGLGVCRYVCEQWGGEFLVGVSDVDEGGLGGLRVEMRFGTGK